MNFALILPFGFYICVLLSLFNLLLLMGIPAIILNSKWGKAKLDQLGFISKNFPYKRY